MKVPGTLLLSVALTAGVVVGLANPQRAFATGTFLETFDGSPASPTPWRGANWDVTVHSRDVGTFNTLDLIHAGHGSDCGAPPATHDVTSYADAVFQCKGHVMTAIKAEGYGAIYLTPNALADFSGGEAVISFDVSTLRTSDRDFLDFWITPFDENVQLAGDVGPVDLNGVPKDAIQIRQNQFNGTTIYRGNVVRNFVSTMVGSNDFLSEEALVTPSAAVRTTFEIHVSRTHLKFGIPSLNAWWVDASFADLGWSAGTFQIAHHSYNPEKADGCGPPPAVTICTANTWHWDNVSITPAIPFSILHSDLAVADTAHGQQMNFSSAPAGAHLRFTGIGTNIETSYDGGRTWQSAQLQSYEQQLGDEHFRSYWTPVPAGTQTVRFRASDWWGGPWMVRNASIWANNAPTPTTPPTTPPTAAPTTRAPTATPAATPRITATPTPTSAATLSPVPTPTATAPAGSAVAGSTVAWQGGNYFLSGANVPWFNWGCDFGCGSGSGISSAAVHDALDAKFALAKASGIRTLRWWAFEGSAWQIKVDASGTPTGLDPAVYADFDSALALASKYDLYLDLVLFSSPTAIPTAWETDASKRQALATSLAPLFARYGNDPHLLSWEIFNEPEFDIWGNKISQSAVQATVGALVTTVHANGSTYVTVGSAMLDGLPMWAGLGLDYYSPHWYDHMNPGDWCAICTDYASLRTKYNLDRPVVIGELYVGSDTPGRLETMYQKGYAGAWAWSLFPDHTNDKLAADLTQYASLAAAHGGLGPVASPGSTLAPTATGTPTPTHLPTAGPTPSPTVPPSPTATSGITAPPSVRAEKPTRSPSVAAAPSETAQPHGAAVGPIAPVAFPIAPAVSVDPTAYHASWVDQSTYPSMQVGQTQQVTIRFRNTGTAPWIKGALGQQANLGVFGDATPYVYPTAEALFQAVAADPASGMSAATGATARLASAATTVWALLAAGWPTPDRAAIQTENIVQPGAVGTFTFSVRAPQVPGVYQLRLRPVVDGTVWMEDQGAFIVVTSVADYHSAWVSQSAYPTVRAGAASTPITITFRNTGTMTWAKGTVGQQVNLGLTDGEGWSEFGIDWPTLDRVATQTEATVPPGQPVSFTFRVKAPTAPGTYRLRVRPVVDGTMWLEDEGVFVLLTVVP